MRNICNKLYDIGVSIGWYVLDKLLDYKVYIDDFFRENQQEYIGNHIDDMPNIHNIRDCVFAIYKNDHNDETNTVLSHKIMLATSEMIDYESDYVSFYKILPRKHMKMTNHNLLIDITKSLDSSKYFLYLLKDKKSHDELIEALEYLEIETDVDETIPSVLNNISSRHKPFMICNLTVNIIEADKTTQLMKQDINGYVSPLCLEENELNLGLILSMLHHYPNQLQEIIIQYFTNKEENNNIIMEFDVDIIDGNCNSIKNTFIFDKEKHNQLVGEEFKLNNLFGERFRIDK